MGGFGGVVRNRRALARVGRFGGLRNRSRSLHAPGVLPAYVANLATCTTCPLTHARMVEEGENLLKMSRT